jgi:hypothetical protein
LLDVDGAEEEAGKPLLEEGLSGAEGLRDAAQWLGKKEESGVIIVPGVTGIEI